MEPNNPSHPMGLPGGPPPPRPGAPPPKPQKKQAADVQMFDKMSRDVNTIGANLRILEERFVLMRNRSQVTEGSMIEMERGLAKDIKMINDDILDLKHELKDIMDKLMLIDNEMKSLTKREEFKVAERYLDMWQPMEFLTRKEFDRLIEEHGGVPRSLPRTIAGVGDLDLHDSSPSQPAKPKPAPRAAAARAQPPKTVPAARKPKPAAVKKRA